MSSIERQYAPVFAASSSRRHRSPLDIVPAATPRKRGRPPLATPEQVQLQIRAAAESGRLFRVHLEQPALYARARRMWGSWSGALAALGLDHATIVSSARERSLVTRRERRGAPGKP